jgi:hypothetical protein
LGKGLSLKPKPLDPEIVEMAKQLFDVHGGAKDDHPTKG